MKDTKNLSVQLTCWSDNYEKAIHKLFTQTTKKPYEEATVYKLKCLTRLSNKNIQTLWKTRMQMRQRARSWTKVLFIHKSTWRQTQARLCTTKLSNPSTRICDELQANEANLRRNVQYQSRNTKTQRKTLKGNYCAATHSHKYHDVSDLSCQYAARLFEKTLREKSSIGGKT